MLKLAAIFYSGLFLLGIAINAARRAPLVPLAFDRRFGPALAAALAVALATFAFSSYARTRFEWSRRLETTFRSALGPLTGGDVLFLALASGTSEEVFFRGALQPALAHLMGSKAAGLLFATAVFAIVHTGRDPALRAWTAFAFVLGLFLGGVTLACGNVLPAAACHVLVNALNLRQIARPIAR